MSEIKTMFGLEGGLSGEIKILLVSGGIEGEMEILLTFVLFSGLISLW